jgi:hypothetical protein
VRPTAALAVLTCAAALSACTPFPTSELFSFAETVTIGTTVQQRQTNCIDIPSSSGSQFGLGVVNTTLTTGETDPRITVTVTGFVNADRASSTWSQEDLDEGTAHRVTFPVGDGSIYTFTGRATGPNCVF